LALTRTTGGAIIPTTYDTTIVKDSLRVDPATGDLIWDVPKNAGQFNFAIQIEEWRLGPPPSLRWVKVGSVTRDLQIDISSNCQNLPPEIIPVGPFCVEAGSNLNFNVTASDPDGDRVSLTAFGNPFEAPSPADAFNFSSASPVTGTFNWDTKCVHIRRQPYYVTFEAKDFPALTQSPRLTDVYTTEITVIAPAPRNPSATPNLDNINLAWSKGVCDISDTINGGYKIYRREETYGFIPSACETGVPEYTGYELVGRTKAGDTTYTDTTGLQKGIRYCYMVVSCFADAVESYASIEFCAALPLTSALLTKVDILSTDLATGSVQVEWISPPVLDTANFPPPYEYRLYRSDSINGTAFQQIQVLQGIANTSYTDANLNTQSLGYNYRVDFYSGTTASFVGSSPTSSSVYLKVKPVDQKNELDFSHNTSWRNDRFTIFRETAPGSGIFDSIAESFSPNYIDTGLTNGTTYCYRVKSTGAYTASDSLPKPLINNSQINCATPLDTNLPCTPILSYEFNCDSGYAIFYAQMPNDPTCDDQITEYRLYKKDTPQEDFTTTPIASVMSPDSSFLLLRVDLGKSLTGCYAVTAIDDAGSDPQGTANESLLSNVICIDGCPSLQFPNIFTPNADGINDFFLPINPQDITYINIKIYNRWGTSVFENGNIRFLVDGWNGTDQNTSQELADGVYYYVCQYSANTLTGPPLREVTGYVHLFKGE
jgi:gliding motility-associated-like protein